jgi:cysteine-rich repeat protein
MRRPLISTLFFAALAAASAGSCAEGESLMKGECPPNRRTFCRCPDGENSGTQLCGADGRAVGECEPCPGGEAPPGPGPSASPGPLPARPPVCGNAIIEPGEACHDGNAADGDECSSLCQRSTPEGPAPGQGLDTCEGVTAVPVQIGVEFRASQSLSVAGADLRGSCGGDGADLVFAGFTAIAGRLRLTVTPDDPSLDPVVYVRAGSCESDASELAGGCRNAGGPGAEEGLDVPVEGGAVYFVIVDSQGAASAAGSFTVRARVDPPDPCASEGLACDTGMPGACAGGVLRCVEGQGLVCLPEQAPAAEACGDGLDNDCDGGFDEGCPCAHDKCDEGGSLDPSCTVDGAVDPCVQAVCEGDPYCCDPETSWDDICVSKVYLLCGTISCEAHGGDCEHGVCEEGEVLERECDGSIGCVDRVCAAEESCCDPESPFGWDFLCLSLVATECEVAPGVPVCPAP